MLRLSLLFCALVLLASAIADPSQFDTSDPIPSGDPMPHHSEPHHSGDPMGPSGQPMHSGMPHHSADPLPPLNSNDPAPHNSNDPAPHGSGMPPMDPSGQPGPSGGPIGPIPSGSGGDFPPGPMPSGEAHSGMPMPSGSGDMPGPAMPTTLSPTTTSTPTTTGASGTPAPSFSPQRQNEIKAAAEAIISNLPTTLDVNITGNVTVTPAGVVTITASVEGGCATVTANQADFQGTGANTFTVVCVEVTSRRRLLAAQDVSLTFTPTQGPTFAPSTTSTTPNTDSPASATMPSALAFLAVVVAAIAF